ncbi:MAG TPA: hypothetical protein VNU97_03565 [Rhizomicrobium sp.]|nr:hypothetical protein [Rhizomicrobium sp.]
MPLALATRLLLTTTIALWVLGPVAIQRALFGRVGAGALLPAFFAYNANFMWGFFNYTFAVGLAFLVFAAWIASDGRRTILHQIGFAIAFTLIYFSHLFALAVLLLAIGGFEISNLLAQRPIRPRQIAGRLLSLVAICLPAAIAFLVLKPSGAGSTSLEFDLAGTMQDRFAAAIQIGFDKPALLVTAALIVLFVAGRLTRRMTIHPRMRVTLVLFTLGALLMPEWALGGWGVHMRLPAVLGALAFSSVEWQLPPRALVVGAAVVLLLFGAGAALLTQTWRTYDAQFVEFRAHASDVMPGGRLLTVLDGDSLGLAPDQPYWHIAEYAIIDRNVFTPLMFTTAGQHVVHLRPPFEHIAATNARQGSPPDVDELDDLAASRVNVDQDYRDIYPYLLRFQCHFDQAVVIRGAGPHTPVPAMLRLRHEGGFYALYDIVPDSRCAKP